MEEYGIMGYDSFLPLALTHTLNVKTSSRDICSAPKYPSTDPYPILPCRNSDMKDMTGEWQKWKKMLCFRDPKKN